MKKIVLFLCLILCTQLSAQQNYPVVLDNVRNQQMNEKKGSKIVLEELKSRKSTSVSYQHCKSQSRIFYILAGSHVAPADREEAGKVLGNINSLTYEANLKKFLDDREDIVKDRLANYEDLIFFLSNESIDYIVFEMFSRDQEHKYIKSTLDEIVQTFRQKIEPKLKDKSLVKKAILLAYGPTVYILYSRPTLLNKTLFLGADIQNKNSINDQREMLREQYFNAVDDVITKDSKNCEPYMDGFTATEVFCTKILNENIVPTKEDMIGVLKQVPTQEHRKYALKLILETVRFLQQSAERDKYMAETLLKYTTGNVVIETGEAHRKGIVAEIENACK